MKAHTMAYTVPHQQPDPIERVLATAAHLIEGLAAKYAHHRVMQTSLNELRSLSVSELADLALNPSMLRSIAKEAADKQVVL